MIIGGGRKKWQEKKTGCRGMRQEQDGRSRIQVTAKGNRRNEAGSRRQGGRGRMVEAGSRRKKRRD